MRLAAKQAKLESAIAFDNLNLAGKAKMDGLAALGIKLPPVPVQLKKEKLEAATNYNRDPIEGFEDVSKWVARITSGSLNKLPTKKQEDRKFLASITMGECMLDPAANKRVMDSLAGFRI